MDQKLRDLERRLAVGDPGAEAEADRFCRRLDLPPPRLDAFIERRAPGARLADAFLGRRRRLRQAFNWARNLAEDGGTQALEHAWETVRASRFPYFKPGIAPEDAAARALVDVRRGQAERFFTTRFPGPASPAEVARLIAELHDDPDHEPRPEDILALLIALPAGEDLRDWKRLLAGRFKGYFEYLSAEDYERIKVLELDHIDPLRCPVLFARSTDRAAAWIISIVAWLALGLGLALLGLGLKHHIAQGGAAGPFYLPDSVAFTRYEITALRSGEEGGAKSWSVEARRDEEEARTFEVEAGLAALLADSDGLLAAELNGQTRALFPTADAGPSTLKIVAFYVFGGLFAVLGAVGLLSVMAVLLVQGDVVKATWPDYLPGFNEVLDLEDDA